MFVGELAKKGFSKLLGGLLRREPSVADNVVGEAGETAVDGAAKAAAKNPWYRQKKTYIIPPVLAGGAYAGYNVMSGDDTPPAGVRDYSQFTGRDGATNEALTRMLEDQQQRYMSTIERDRAKALAGYGNEERARLNQMLTERNTFLQGQAGALRDEFGRVGGLYGDNVASARQAGAEGAQGIRNVYGKAAAQTRKAARSKSGPAGKTRTGGLTPVSGSLASMPLNIQSTGASLAQYLGDQAAIAARDAGFDAATAVEYGNAVANDVAVRSYFDSLDKQNALEMELLRGKNATSAMYDQMMSDTEREFMDRQFRMQEDQLVQQAFANVRPENLTPRDWQKVDDAFDAQIRGDDQEKLNWEAVGVYDSTDWAQWLAEEGILGEVVYGQPE
jgi:hypothetical protein